MRSDANEAVGFQFGLVEAIGKAPAWFLTNDEITELENLTLGQERDNVKQWHWTSTVNVNVNFVGQQFMAMHKPICGNGPRIPEKQTCAVSWWDEILAEYFWSA